MNVPLLRCRAKACAVLSNHGSSSFSSGAYHYEQLVNPVAVVHENIGDDTANIVKFPLKQCVNLRITWHNLYTDLEAQERTKSQAESLFNKKALLSKALNERRHVVKELFYRVPARPLLKFVFYYVVRKGFLNGEAGFTYSTLQVIYEYMIQLKVTEIEIRNLNLPI